MKSLQGTSGKIELDYWYGDPYSERLDQDFDVRYYAVIGLAEITGQLDWHPNEEIFRAEEAKYLQHWRQWAQINYPSS